MTYQVTVTRAGAKLATVKTEAPDALVACWNAERKLQAKRGRVQLVSGDKVETVMWTGLECTARRVAEK